MNSLIAYGSSDEDEGDVQPSKPAKIAKLGDAAPDVLTNTLQGNEIVSPRAHPKAALETRSVKASSTVALPAREPGSIHGVSKPPAVGPSAAPDTAPSTAPASPPGSPYTNNRQRIHELTMPPLPNFSIPDSPPPPSPSSASASILETSTAQFARFLELKKQGVHFNARLQDSTSLRNPSLLPKLLAFAGVEGEEQYASALPEGCGVSTKWPEEWYVENLLREDERREGKRKAERDRVDFVPAKAAGGESSKRSGSRFDRS
ncbi:hypothetical protein B0A48_05749 [Cryoendolithus antarcticus]|uniref:HCNGP-like protein n=1 Tax=Cryoendolithus antarcticus TaxID=1507870 RepID=A0A1V8TBU6_9PEZI|nr:hypothetical protein B0A48_05749 [Cryoendolithus antarcticus]